MLLSLLLLAGCGEVVAPDNGAKPTAPVAPKAAKDDDDEVNETDAWQYNPAGKRDPFQNFLGPAITDDGGVDDKQPPLQRWEVERYVLRGVIFNAEAPRALLIDPEGLGHVVRLGTYVGRSWGKVTSIEDKKIVITEEYKTPEDDLVVNTIELRLGLGGE